jgi:hypothetical protein
MNRMTQHFGYAVDRRYLPVLLPFGFKRDRDGVTLADGAFKATFGFFTVSTARVNITGAHITRNYRWWTAFGARASMADDGLSFGTNHEAGVCIHFAEGPVAVEQARPLGAHRDRRGPRGADQGPRRRSGRRCPVLTRIPGPCASFVIAVTRGEG